jgi:hypothetical protein
MNALLYFIIYQENANSAIKQNAKTARILTQPVLLALLLKFLKTQKYYKLKFSLIFLNYLIFFIYAVP